MYTEERGQQRGEKCLSHRHGIVIDKDANISPVPDSVGYRTTVPFGDGRAGHVQNDTTNVIQEGVEKMDNDTGKRFSARHS